MEENNELWEKAVEQARYILKSTRKSQMEVAEIACRVCDITWGGRKHGHLFTQKRFAKDIGMQPRTLMNWTKQYKKVYSKLDKTTQKLITYDQIRDIALKVEEDSHPSEIKKLFIQTASIPRERIKFIKYLKTLNSILYNATRPARLEYCDTDLILKMIQSSNAIERCLRKYIQERESGKTIRDKTRQTKLYQAAVSKYKDLQ